MCVEGGGVAVPISVPIDIDFSFFNRLFVFQEGRALSRWWTNEGWVGISTDCDLAMYVWYLP